MLLNVRNETKKIVAMWAGSVVVYFSVYFPVIMPTQ